MTTNSLDLFVLSEIMVTKEARELNDAKLEGRLKEEDGPRLEYYNQTLSDLASFNLKNSSKVDYEAELDNLSSYDRSMMAEIMQIASMLE